MKIEELRIGNIVHIPQTKTNEQIGCIEENGRFVIKGYKSSYSSIECLRPIPLTEEWLIKFGLTYSNQSRNYSSEKICVFNDLKSINIYYSSYGCDYEFECPKYVHQLQNLYFALTGCELQYVA